MSTTGEAGLNRSRPPVDDDPAMEGLASAVASELDDLLTIILGYTELAQRAVRDHEDPSRDFRVALAAAERARELSNRLHTLGSRRHLREQPVNLGRALLEMRDRLEHVIGSSVGAETSTPPDAWIRIDPDLLEQLVVELAENAQHAIADAGWVSIVMRSASLADGRPGVALVVRDNGRGMSPEVLAHCRDPLFTTNPRGTGLGLAVVAATAERTGSELHIESETGRGTEVTVVFPLVPPADA